LKGRADCLIQKCGPAKPSQNHASVSSRTAEDHLDWDKGLAGGRTPLISNTDQGSQFTSEAYLDAVESAGVDVSMDGRGRWIDNRFIERLRRSAKYEDIYLQDYSDGLTAQRGLSRWFEDYNLVRPH
jgi:transposase InsO family protein